MRAILPTHNVRSVFLVALFAHLLIVAQLVLKAISLTKKLSNARGVWFLVLLVLLQMLACLALMAIILKVLNASSVLPHVLPVLLQKPAFPASMVSSLMMTMYAGSVPLVV